MLSRSSRPGTIAFRSSGTTGEGSEVSYSPDVMAGASRRLGEVLRRTPFAPEMRAAICFGYGCFPPAEFYQQFFLSANCDVMPLGSGRNLPTDFKCEWLRRRPANLIIGMPSYLIRLGKILSSQCATGVRSAEQSFLVTGGEPIGEARRHLLRELFHVRVYDHYGLLEAPMVAGECSKERLHISKEYGAEVKHGDGVSETGRGELLLSSAVAWPGVSMRRLRTGDEAHLFQDSCDCGDDGQTMSVMGRMNNERKIKGVRVSLPSLHRALMELPIVDYYIEVERNALDTENATLYVDGPVEVDAVRMRLVAILPTAINIEIVEELVVPVGPTGKPIRYVEK